MPYAIDLVSIRWLPKYRFVLTMSILPRTNLIGFIKKHATFHTKDELDANGLIFSHYPIPRTLNTHADPLTWTPPNVGKLKVDVDTSIDSINRKVRISVVLCNHLGVTLASGVVPISAFLSLSIAEAIAVLQGLLLCLRLGYSTIKVSMFSPCRRNANRYTCNMAKLAISLENTKT
ncbi:hypothetical protein F8388_009589 [Cannabis sativa]|uniref:RNase H type-1 domain-containing protein n=1 Tax=Cannabis sativa TaxID=3483 RepID=A0A7J6E834_CANSA|nr:hypothetical protein F8388_009589 [Cannabis sativa]